VTAIPLEQLDEKIPSLSRLLLFNRFDDGMTVAPFFDKKQLQASLNIPSKGLE
jgi:hypothetical protein